MHPAALSAMIAQETCVRVAAGVPEAVGAAVQAAPLGLRQRRVNPSLVRRRAKMSHNASKRSAAQIRKSAHTHAHTRRDRAAI